MVPLNEPLVDQSVHEWCHSMNPLLTDLYIALGTCECSHWGLCSVIHDMLPKVNIVNGSSNECFSEYECSLTTFYTNPTCLCDQLTTLPNPHLPGPYGSAIKMPQKCVCRADCQLTIVMNCLADSWPTARKAEKFSNGCITIRGQRFISILLSALLLTSALQLSDQFVFSGIFICV